MKSTRAHEQWRPVPGYEGLYEVSDHGRILSTRTGKFLTAALDRRHLHVSFYWNGTRETARVHRVVMEAFAGPCPDGAEVRHLDDDPYNNRLDNLAYGTRSENMHDRVRLGTHHYARRAHCVNGHEFTPDNTLSSSKSGRRCRECHRAESFERKRQSPQYKGGLDNKDKTHCPHGHEYTPSNTCVNNKGSRVCKSCKADQQRRRRALKKESACHTSSTQVTDTFVG